jgi:hypothetical protein
MNTKRAQTAEWNKEDNAGYERGVQYRCTNPEKNQFKNLEMKTKAQYIQIKNSVESLANKLGPLEDRLLGIKTR